MLFKQLKKFHFHTFHEASVTTATATYNNVLSKGIRKRKDRRFDDELHVDRIHEDTNGENESFILPSHIHWYPGHMARAMKQLHDTIERAHLVLEVRDARLPLSSANAMLDDAIERKKKARIVVLNKRDLISDRHAQAIERHFAALKTPCLLLRSSEQQSIVKMLKLVECSHSRKFKSVPTGLAVIGFPNVGKSSIINGMRRMAGKTNPAAVGSLPGVTRHINGFMVQDRPPIYVFDTPGILLPNFRDDVVEFSKLDGEEKRLLKKQEREKRNAFASDMTAGSSNDGAQKHTKGILLGLKLGAIGAIKDNIIGEELLVGFILQQLNLRHQHKYVDVLRLNGPVYSHLHLLLHVAQQLSGSAVTSATDDKQYTLRAAQHILRLFRSGKLGECMLDDLNNTESRTFDHLNLNSVLRPSNDVW